MEGIGAMCSEADSSELDYVVDRVEINKNLLQRFRPKRLGPFNAIPFYDTSISS